MNTALCVLLPVYNAQNSLATAVAEILEVLPELTNRFQLCILDDGSTDDTADVAYDLAAQYPQIGVIRHPMRMGLAEAIQTGLDHTEGEIVFIGDEDYNLEPEDLRTLWQLRDTERRLSARGDGRPSAHRDWMNKLLAWKPRRHKSRDQIGFQVIRRDAFEHFRLQQAADRIRRIDRAVRTPVGGTSRPKYLSPAQRFAWDD